jgi:MFS family permease
MLPGAALGILALLLIAPQEGCSPEHGCPKLFDARLLAGPVGLLTATEVASSLAYLTFASAVPLWLVAVHGVARDAALIGWTLATFSLSAALGGILAGLLSARIGRRPLVAGSTLLAPVPLLAVFQLEPGSLAYFLAVGLGGGLVNAGLPLKVVTAQELAPRAVATASGMLMGLAMGIAGLLYVGIGALQETIGLVPAASLAYAPLLPAAVLAFAVLGRRGSSPTPRSADAAGLALAGASCSCPGGYAAAMPTSATSPAEDGASIDPTVRCPCDTLQEAGCTCAAPRAPEDGRRADSAAGPWRRTGAATVTRRRVVRQGG